jgi:hypothetical protein
VEVLREVNIHLTSNYMIRKPRPNGKMCLPFSLFLHLRLGHPFPGYP